MLSENVYRIDELFFFDLYSVTSLEITRSEDYVHDVTKMINKITLLV